MTSCIELHDSTLYAAGVEESGFIIELRPAYVHRSEGEAGQDAGSVFLQNFRIVVGDPVASSRAYLLPARLGDGQIGVGDKLFTNTLPTALQESGRVRIQLFVAGSDAPLDVAGSSISIQALGEPRFLEVFPGCKR